jgi:hypothetical protein
MEATSETPKQDRPQVVLARLAPLAVFGLATAWLLNAILSQQPRFVYPLDDAYIHLAIAKNVVEHGVWGPTSEGFVSCSSSPLWTLLLAATFFLTGTQDIAPLCWALAFAAGAAGLLYALPRQLGASPGFAAASGACATLSTSLPALALLGMEHALHVLLVLALFSLWMRGAGRGSARDFAVFCVAGALMAATRYEGLFLLLGFCGVLALDRRLGRAVALGLSSLAPVAAFGLYSIASGGWFFPISVWRKASIQADASLWEKVAILGHKLTASAPELYALLFALAFCWLIRETRAQNEDAAEDADPSRTEAFRAWRQLETAWMASFILHAVLAKIHHDRIGRYESYLVASGACLVAGEIWALARPLAARPFGLTRWRGLAAWSACVVLLLGPLGSRVWESHFATEAGAKNIHDQQYQMALFLKAFYPKQGIVINDIGAVCFLDDYRLIDLGGVASEIIARQHIRGDMMVADALQSEARAKEAKVAAVYASWFEGMTQGALPSWRPAGRWIISGNVACAHPDVTFYAIGDANVIPLLVQLKRFEPSLPKDVRVEYFFALGGSAQEAAPPVSARP